MALPCLNQLLKQAKIDFSIHHYPTAYTAQEIAQRARIEGKRLAKTVIVKLDGKLAMVVLPANHIIDMVELPIALHAQQFELAMERDFEHVFEECDSGALPPFGNLFDMEVYMDESLSNNDTISFSTGEHDELLEISYHDFEQLVHPRKVRDGFFTIGPPRHHEHPRMGKLRH